MKIPVKPIELISVRMEKRAMKTLGQYLRASKQEPVNEAMRGDEEIWKLPCKEYHINCREGHPMSNWLIDTATLAWDEHKLWKKIGNREHYIPIDFNHKLKTHTTKVIQSTLSKVF